jgi:CheY-like chemotaxis protein
VARVRPILERQVDQLVRMVDDLLDVARVSTGRIVLERGPVRLREVLEWAIETALPAAHAGDVALSSTLPPAEVVIDADAARLGQVFGNVLQNAVKFTPQGGRITVDWAIEPGRTVTVIVRDTGCGIEAGLLPRLFDFFVQGRDSSGLGIGLALSRRLLELHGATITAASDGLGQGCTFTIVLPVGATVAPAAAPVAGAAGAEAERVLVIDDSVDGTEMLAQVLQLLGVDVRTANSGQEGLALAASFLPGIVLLDLGMPGMNGYEVCERLRATPGGAALHIIAVTGWGQPEDRVRSAAAGFDGHVTKPVDVDVLAALLANARSVSK